MRGRIKLTAAESNRTSRVPGYAASVVEDGVPRRSLAGLASIEWDSPIDAQTHFHGASLAKQFTALAVLQLERQGRLELDGAIGRYVKGLRPSLADLTLRQLLTHTSGVRDQWPLMELAGWRGNDPITTDDVLDVLNRQATPQFPPGTRFMYSNSGYTLAAAAVSGVTGVPFREYASQEVFGPLGMDDTLIAGDPTEPVLRSAGAYSAEGRRSSPNLFVAGSTSLVTTLSDYEKWLVAHRADSDWRPFIDVMQAPQQLDDGTKTGYGLAYFLLGDVALHTGNDFGFSAYMADHRDRDRQVALFSNASIANVLAAASNVMAGKAPVGDILPTSDAINAPGLAGAYESVLGEIRVIEVEAGRIRVNWGGRVPLRSTGDHRFRSDSGETYEFGPFRGDTADGFTLSTPLATSRWTRIRPLSREVLLPKEGLYWSDETGACLVVESDGQGLLLRLPKQEPRRLKSVDDSRFAGEGLWISVARSQQAVRISLPRCLGVEYRKR